MIDLCAAQARLWLELKAVCGGGCFLRVCRDDGALWVSDAPRLAITPQAPPAFAALGVACVLDGRSRLWRLDFTTERWESEVAGLPPVPPPLPACDAVHGAYALCRVLLAHPCELSAQPLGPLRRVLKAGPQGMEDVARLLREETALRLRQGRPVAHAAGRVLAAWLQEIERTDEV